MGKRRADDEDLSDGPSPDGQNGLPPWERDLYAKKKAKKKAKKRQQPPRKV